MQRLLKYISDVRVLTPFLVIVLLELFLQSGIYGRWMLEKNSYADQIRRSLRVIRNSPVEPNVLILGTSVAYQGIHLPLMNRLLEENNTGLVVQSAACEGCMMQTQYMLYKTLHEEFPKLRTIVHVLDATLDQKSRYESDQPNLSMLAQLPRGRSLAVLDEMRFDVGFNEYAYFYLRTMTFRADLRDFVLSPAGRIRNITERLRDDEQQLYTYVNDYQYAIDAFSKKGDLLTCAKNALAGVNDEGQVVPKRPDDSEDVQPDVQYLTDRHHRNAAELTCAIAHHEKTQKFAGARQWQNLFFERLDTMYDGIDAGGFHIVTIYAPYSDLIGHIIRDERKAYWDEEIAKIHGDRPYLTLDTRRSLGDFDDPRSRRYFYDVLHLNGPGARQWTRHLAGEFTKHAAFLRGEDDAR